MSWTWLNPYLQYNFFHFFFFFKRKVTETTLRTLDASLHQGCPWLFRDFWQVHSDPIDTVHHRCTLMRALCCRRQRRWYVMGCGCVFLYCIWWQCQFCIDSLQIVPPPSLHASSCYLSALLSFSDLSISFQFHFICIALPRFFLIDIVPK